MSFKSYAFSTRVLAAVALAFSVLAAAPASAEEIVARLSYHWGPAHHSAIYAEKFAKLVNERGKGKIRIETFPSGQLFGIREIMGAITSGAVEMGGVVGIVSFPPINKNYGVEALPGVFADFQQLRGFFREDPTGKKVWNDILDRTQSTFLAYDPVGPYMNFTTKHALTSPDSYKGLKARYLSSTERPRWSALGADAVSMPTREVYTALQNGMIDTLSTVPSAIKAYSWWEYLKYAQKPYLFYADAFILSNRAWFDGLPDDVKKILTDAGQEISTESTESIMQFSQKVLDQFKERGGQVDTLSQKEQKVFSDIDKKKVLPALANEIDPEVVKAAQAYAAK